MINKQINDTCIGGPVSTEHFKFLTKIKLCEKICKSFKPFNKPIININQ